MANESDRRPDRRGRRRRGPQASAINDPPIDLTTITPEKLNSEGEKWGKELKNANIKTNQIRNIYGAVQHIRFLASRPDADTADLNRRLIFLKPKLAYASGRQGKLKPLRKLLVQAIDSVVASPTPEKARENFFFLLESIVAYHKFHGGRDS